MSRIFLKSVRRVVGGIANGSNSCNGRSCVGGVVDGGGRSGTELTSLVFQRAQEDSTASTVPTTAALAPATTSSWLYGSNWSYDNYKFQMPMVVPFAAAAAAAAASTTMAYITSVDVAAGSDNEDVGIDDSKDSDKGWSTTTKSLRGMLFPHPRQLVTSCDAPSTHYVEPTDSTVTAPQGEATASTTTRPGKSTTVKSQFWYAPREAGSEGDDDTATPPQRSILRRMTNVGRFSLLSETRSNPSVPVLVLVATEQQGHVGGDKQRPLRKKTNGFTAEDFVRLYDERGISTKHPRFTARLDPTGTYFILPAGGRVGGADNEEKTMSKNAVTVRDVAYPVGGRAELVNWINDALLKPIPLQQTLWDAQIASGGALGRSGAINPHRLEAIQDDDGSTVAGSEVIESLIVFRAHHCLADGVSLGVVFGDFMDEGPQINALVEKKVQEYYESQRRRRNKKIRGFVAWWKRFLTRLAKLLYFWWWGTIKAFAYYGYLIAESLITDSRTNPWTVLKKAYENNNPGCDDVDDDDITRYAKKLAWGYVAPVDEVKKVANYYSRQLNHGDSGQSARKSRVTVNDIFCSCVSAAIVKLLKYHQAVNPSLPKMSLSAMNLVMPVHMQGGILLPGQSLGNKIGALVTQIPGEPPHDHHQQVSGDVKLSLMKSPGDVAQQRLLAVHREIQERKETPAAFWSYVIASIMGAIGGLSTSSSLSATAGGGNYDGNGWTSFLFQKASANASVVVTNIRGPEHAVHLDGRPVQSFLGFLPLPPGIPVGMVVGSYQGEIQLAVTAERWAVPDADRFLGWVVDEYNILKDHAGVS